MSMLPDELLWSEGHHASDVVLTALADGQHAIVPNSVRAHVTECPICTAHLGHSALLSLEAQRVLAVPPVRRPFPRLAVALGLVTAALGLIPYAIDADHAPAQMLSRAARSFASLTARLDASGGSTLGVVVMYVAAACFVFAGLALARLSPKKEVSR
jgi:hypothetical protein